MMISIMGACKHDKEATATSQTPASNNDPNKEIAKLEVLSKIDTGTFFKANPAVRNKNMFGPKFENLTDKQRIYTFKSRVYFGMNMRNEGSIASKIMKLIARDSSLKTAADKIIEAKDLKFADGQSKLEGTESDEMKIFSLATYIPFGELTLKVNVNTADPKLRKERINNFKQEMNNVGAEVSKFIFDENSAPVLKEGVVSFEIDAKPMQR